MIEFFELTEDEVKIIEQYKEVIDFDTPTGQMSINGKDDSYIGTEYSIHKK